MDIGKTVLHDDDAILDDRLIYWFKWVNTDATVQIWEPVMIHAYSEIKEKIITVWENKF